MSTQPSIKVLVASIALALSTSVLASPKDCPTAGPCTVQQPAAIAKKIELIPAPLTRAEIKAAPIIHVSGVARYRWEQIITWCAQSSSCKAQMQAAIAHKTGPWSFTKHNDAVIALLSGTVGVEMLNWSAIKSQVRALPPVPLDGTGQARLGALMGWCVTAPDCKASILTELGKPDTAWSGVAAGIMRQALADPKMIAAQQITFAD